MKKPKMVTSLQAEPTEAEPTETKVEDKAERSIPDKLRLLGHYLEREEETSRFLLDAADEIDRLRATLKANMEVDAKTSDAGLHDYLVTEDTPVFLVEENANFHGRIEIVGPQNKGGSELVKAICASGQAAEVYVRRVVKAERPKGALGEAFVAAGIAFFKRYAAEPPDVTILVNGKTLWGSLPIDPTTDEDTALKAAYEKVGIDEDDVKKVMYVPGKMISIIVDKAKEPKPPEYPGK